MSMGGQYTWMDRCLFWLTGQHKDHDPTNVQALNAGRSGSDLDARFGDGSTSTTYPTKNPVRHGYSCDGGDYFAAMDGVAQPNTLSAINLPVSVGFVATPKADFSADGGLWRASQTVLELRTEAGAGRKVPFNIGFDLNTVSLGRGSVVKYSATQTLHIYGRYIVVGVFGLTNYTIFIDGQPRGTGAHGGGDESTGGTANVSNFYICARTTDAGAPSNLFTGSLENAFVIPEELGQVQAMQYTRLMTEGRNRV